MPRSDTCAPRSTTTETLFPETDLRLEKELQARALAIKVLSLFFIDRVANYRDYGVDGEPVKAKFAVTFEEALAELVRDERYPDLTWPGEPV